MGRIGAAVAWLPVGLAGLVLFGQIEGSAAGSRRPFGGTIQVPVLDALTRTDPILIASESEWLVARQLHETLFRLNAKGQLVLALAQEMPRIADDSREFVVQLRPDATFHDGTPVTSQEVIGSWERLLSPASRSPHWWLLAQVQGAVGYRLGRLTRVSGLEPINKLSLRIRLQSPSPEFINALAAVPTAVLPGKVLRNKESPDAHPPGAGPFQLASEQEPGRFALVPFAGHCIGRPFLDRVTFRTFDSPRDAGMAFELGRVAVSWLPSGRSGSSARAVEGPVNRQVFLVISPRRLEKSPEGLRRAVLDAVDRSSLANYLVGDRGGPADELLVFEPRPTGSVGPRPDPARARKYFEALAVERMGMPAMLEFIVRQDLPDDRAAAERIQVNLVDVGASVFVVPLEPEEYRQRVAEDRYDFRLERPLPLVRSTQLQLIGMVARIEGERAVEELEPVLAGLPREGGRTGILRERARGTLARVNWLPLFVFGRQAFVQERIRDYRLGVSGLADLAEVWSTQ
jgi:ABC-type transport system substrate-binding protein